MSASHPFRPRAAAWRARAASPLAVLAVVLLVEARRAGVAAWGPWFEREGNARLSGYVLQLGSARLRPWTLTLTFRDVVVRQLAHPEPRCSHCRDGDRRRMAVRAARPAWSRAPCWTRPRW